MAIEGQMQTTNGLKHLPVRFFSNNGFVRQLLSLFLFAIKNQLPNVGQGGQGIRIIVPVGATAPDGMLIELNGFFAHIAIHHCPQPTIANGQSIFPYLARRLVVPEFERWCRLRKAKGGNG